MRSYLILIVFYSFSSCTLFSQEIPNEFFLFESKKILIDAGLNWSDNTTFSSPRFDKKSENKSSRIDSMSVDFTSGLKTINEGISIYSFLRSRYKKHCHPMCRAIEHRRFIVTVKTLRRAWPNNPKSFTVWCELSP